MRKCLRFFGWDFFNYVVGFNEFVLFFFLLNGAVLLVRVCIFFSDFLSEILIFALRCLLVTEAGVVTRTGNLDFSINRSGSNLDVVLRLPPLEHVRIFLLVFAKNL